MSKGGEKVGQTEGGGGGGYMWVGIWVGRVNRDRCKVVGEREETREEDGVGIENKSCIFFSMLCF